MSTSLLMCPRCATLVLPQQVLDAKGDLSGRCGGCGVRLRVLVFPSALRGPAKGLPSEKRLSEEDAACFDHLDRKATAACDACGKFLCGGCCIPFGARTLCATCVEREVTSPSRTDFIQQADRKDVGTVALFALPFSVGFFAFVLALAGYLPGNEPAGVGDALMLGLMCAGGLTVIFLPAALAFYLWGRKARRLSLEQPERAPYPTIGLVPWRPRVQPYYGLFLPVEFLFGWGSFTLFERCSLYWLEDYLLISRRSGSRERYERLYFRDLWALRMHQSRDHVLVSILLFAASGLCIYMPWLLELSWQNEVAIGVFAVLEFVSLGLAVYNLYLGACCELAIFTPIACVRIRAVSRWSAGLRLAEQVKNRIAAVQGELPAGDEAVISHLRGLRA